MTKLVHSWFELIGVFKVNVVLKLIVSGIMLEPDTSPYTHYKLYALFKLSKAKSIGLIKE